jgi:hypothetical protein
VGQFPLLTKANLMKMIVNLPDGVIGSWHQVTLEENAGALEGEAQVTVRVDGTAVPPHTMFARDVVRLWLSWSDAFEGVADKDAHIQDATP